MIKLYEEAARCLLCKDPACTAACQKGCDPARMIVQYVLKTIMAELLI